MAPSALTKRKGSQERNYTTKGSNAVQICFYYYYYFQRSHYSLSGDYHLRLYYINKQCHQL